MDFDIFVPEMLFLNIFLFKTVTGNEKEREILCNHLHKTGKGNRRHASHIRHAAVKRIGL